MQHKKSVFLCLILSAFCLLTSCGKEKLVIPQNAVATVYLTYGDKHVDNLMLGEDKQAIFSIFSGKELYNDDLPCSFTDKASLIIDGVHFCPATDRCNVIYVKEKNKLFKLSPKEYDLFDELMGYYGLTYPIEE